MYSSIVVGTDGSETAQRAVEEAARLAEAVGCELHVVSAYKPLRGAHVSGAPAGAAKVWQPLPDSRVEAILQEAALDRYTFIRDAWLQRRRNMVYDGNPPRIKEEE